MRENADASPLDRGVCPRCFRRLYIFELDGEILGHCRNCGAGTWKLGEAGK